MIRGKLLVSVVIGLMVILVLVVACRDTEQTPAATPNAYQASGAIAQAKQLAGRDSYLLREEAAQFGLHLMSWEEDAYRRLRSRLFANDTLASTLLRVGKDEMILVGLGEEFKVGIISIYINVDATDDEIIKFLKDSLPEVKANKTAFEQSVKEASQFGLTLMLWEYDEYKQIRERLLSNERLASALKTSARNGVTVHLERKFSVRANNVDINVDATDEEIIEFLLGK